MDDRLFLEILLTEALSTEIKSFGIDAIVVYPGYFKTNFLLQGSLRTAANPINDYKEARELEILHNEQVVGNQPGDPEKAAAAFIEVAAMHDKPLHLFLGSDSFGMANVSHRASPSFNNCFCAIVLQ